MQLLKVNDLVTPNRPYGALLPGTKTKIPVILAVNLESFQGTHTATFFTNSLMDHNGLSTSSRSCWHTPHVDATVPTRSPDCGAGSPSWARKLFEYNSNVWLINTKTAVTNAWLKKSGREDEPVNTHVRDHIWNVLLHGTIKQHMWTNAEAQLLQESNPEFSFDFDYLWRLPRVLGDVRKVPLMAAEVEDFHMTASDTEDDTMTIRVHTAEGPLRFSVVYPARDLPELKECGMIKSLRRFYGDTVPPTSLNKLITTAIVYSLMQNHGMSRKAAFSFLDIRNAMVYPVMTNGFYTFDNFQLTPCIPYGTKYWDKKLYRLAGEALFDGTASEEDIQKFKELTGTTWDYLQDVQAMFALKEPMDSELWWGGVNERPDWANTSTVCDILCRYLYEHHDTWDKKELDGKDGLSRVDWTMDWTDWLSLRNNRTDFCLFERLGVIPFLPRISPDKAQLPAWDWLATYRLRVAPACLIIWGKIDQSQKEADKLSKALGYKVELSELKEALKNASVYTGLSEAAVFVLGVMTLSGLTKDQARKNIQGFLGLHYKEL